MEAQTKTAIKPVTFESIEEDYRAKGIDITDINRLHGSGPRPGHFEKWHAAKKLPDHDAEGKHFRSSKIFFQQYQADPEGEAAAPLFVNLWHYLLKISKPILWKETESEMTKTAVVAEGILTVSRDVSDDDLPELRKKIETDEPMSDDLFGHFVATLRMQHRQDVEARKLMLEIIDTYGTEVPECGKVVLIDMKVDC